MTFSNMFRMMAFALPMIAAVPVSAECVPFSDAHKHVGKTQCVSGTVFHVKEGTKGVTFLDLRDL
jgi:hypothetical protein